MEQRTDNGRAILQLRLPARGALSAVAEPSVGDRITVNGSARARGSSLLELIRLENSIQGLLDISELTDECPLKVVIIAGYILWVDVFGRRRPLSRRAQT